MCIVAGKTLKQSNTSSMVRKTQLSTYIEAQQNKAGKNQYIYILPDGIIEDIREFFQIEDSHFEHFHTKRFK